MSNRHLTITVSPVAVAVGLLAVLLTVGSTAYAAGLAKNSVGTKQLKNSAVTAPKLKKDAVTGQKIKNRSVKAADLAAGAVTPRPVVVSRELVAGQSEDVVVAGVTYTVACVSPSGIDTTRLTMAPAVTPGTISLGGISTAVSATLPFFNDATTESSISAIPSAEAAGSTVALTGQVGPTGGTPSLVVAALRAADNAAFPCRAKLTVSPTR